MDEPLSVILSDSVRQCFIQREDLGGRQGLLVYPHVVYRAIKVVAGLRRIASDVDARTGTCGDGATGEGHRRHLDAIEVGAHRGSVIDTDVVVPGSGNKLLDSTQA